MELGKLRCPSIWEEGPRVQDHMAMNVWVLNNFWLIFIAMNKRPLLRLGGMHSWNG